MKTLLIALIIVVIGMVSAGAYLMTPMSIDQFDLELGETNVKRGAYLARVSGCVSCHTTEGGSPLAGGTALETPFGTFYSPNITPDRNAGIGDWSAEDLARALRNGVSPDGQPYYPAFPHAFYASFNDRDIGDLWAALRIVPAVPVAAPPHEVAFPFNIRQGLKPWRALFRSPRIIRSDPSRSESWNRGRFIAEIAHCGACHTPRNFVGARNIEQALAGEPNMLDGGASPPIDAESLNAGGWTRANLVTALKTGLLPDGDVMGASMAEVVRDGTAYVLPQHLDDLAAYLLDQD